MSQSIQSGSTTVSGSVTTTIASQTGNALTSVACALQAGAGSLTLGTVPALKKWRIYGGSMMFYYGAGANYCELLANGAAFLVCGAQTSGCNSVTTNFGNNYIEIAAGQTVVMTVTGGGAAKANVTYQQVDA